MQNNTIEELIQLKQDGKIGWCELALRSDHGKDYLQWCDDHGIEPDDNNAELYLEETESRIYDGGDEFAEEFAGAVV
ncbi:hypothetical protein PRBRB14_13430 [Hallella multisaccharivorax DSM 17128]|uniref:Uncharacterized protein n=1 Tax=Hallella multisaccharivorax DSM 17128 TaxID=688246 RepID=F8NBG6_9BACT|nr:hypothetical protein [Hallella multisaccharivorax]EGN56923.1 hypothetical protein Premu_1509 [Hallella multisaccharivorax DSM 17128]GJG30464.1 hypothetical protein PRBRB14_13430 [Hallella multisaccharivorax DSM 17128]